VRGNSQALFGKRPTEKDPAKGTSPAVHFTRRAIRGNGPGAIPIPRPGPTQPRPSRPGLPPRDRADRWHVTSRQARPHIEAGAEEDTRNKLRGVRAAHRSTRTAPESLVSPEPPETPGRFTAMSGRAGAHRRTRTPRDVGPRRPHDSGPPTRPEPVPANCAGCHRQRPARCTTAISASFRR